MNLARRVAPTFIAWWCRRTVSRRLNVRLHDVGNVPSMGPVLLVSRHYHHYLDGVIYLALLPRRARILVALDWIPSSWLRLPLEWGCDLAGWPAVLRRDRLERIAGTGRSVYAPREATRYLVQAWRTAIDVLRHGEILIIFPEGYPNIDPVDTPKHDSSDFLAFRRGFIRLVGAAQRDQAIRVAIVPVGLSYRPGRRWQVDVRFGRPHYAAQLKDMKELADTIEAEVRRLSG